ncbi:MAG: alpha/beta fold hydrolase [Planctomycetia bacterium]
MRPACPPPVRPIRLATAAALSCLLSAGIASPSAIHAAADGTRFDLETSDGVTLATWCYEPPEDTKPLATVILVHDFEGSHQTVEQFSLALRDAGCVVVVPDLRGHGASTSRAHAGGRDDKLDIRQMRKNDLELIAAGAGGRLREQSAVRGDLETVHAFLTSRAGSAPERLVVVGCGAGATLATLWTAADWAWPPLASGPQGQQVRALVLVSPSWTVKGLSLQPALGSDAIKRDVPLMVLAGTQDRDAIRLFDQLKRQRPREWFDQRAGAEFTKAKDVEKPDQATLFLMQLDTPLSAEKLAAEADATDRIKTFLSLVLDTADER